MSLFRPLRPAGRGAFASRLYREEVLAAAVFALCLLALSAEGLLAHEFKAGDLLIDHPWARATTVGADTGAGYFVVRNAGAAPDRLVSATATFAARVEIHELSMKDGIMAMRPLKEGAAVPASGTLLLEPSGVHLMFIGLKQPLKQGALMDGTLTFEKAGKVAVQYQIEAIGATARDKMHYPVSH